jgi:hypothetical protein
MPTTEWVSLANAGGYSQLNQGSALSNSSSLTDISAGGNQPGQALLIPANALYTGIQLRVTAEGSYSTSGTPNLTLGVYFGGVAGTALATSTFAASANATNQNWRLTADIRCDGVGLSGFLRTQGFVYGLTSGLIWPLPSTVSSGNSVSVATGASAILTIGAQWGTAAPGNSILCSQYLVEQLD